MREPVADVERERLADRVDDVGGAGRPDDLKRHGVGIEGRHPAGDYDVAQVCDVIAVQMCQ